MNKLFDILIIGNKRKASELCAGFSINTEIFVLPNILYLDYRNGMFMATAEDKDIICSKSIIITKDCIKKHIIDIDESFIIKDYQDATTKNLQDKTVFILGAGKTGAEFALWVEKIAKKVYICDNNLKPTCGKVTSNKLIDNPNIVFLANSTVAKYNIIDNKLKSVKLNTYSEIECDYIFEAIGVEPKVKVFERFIELDKNGYIRVNDELASNIVPGVFAIGESTNRAFNANSKTILLESVKKFIKK